MVFHSTAGESILAGARAGGCRLAPALIASVLLHLLLLWPTPRPKALLESAQPLLATLRAPAAPLPAVDSGGAPRRRLPAHQANHTQKIDTDKPRSFAVQAVVPEPAPAEEAGPGPAAAGQPGPQAAVPPTPAPAGALAAASEGPNPDGVRAYRLGLARGARAYKRYPELARERGWEGTAEVRVDVSREGRPRQVLLARSSGHELLDREAVAMLARAAAAAAVPESLRGREFAVSLPVLFDLSEP